MIQLIKTTTRQLVEMLVIIIFSTAAIFGQMENGLSEELTTTANQLLQKQISEKVFTGVVAGISIDGHPTWINAKGYSDKKAEKPMTTQTIIRTASIAKPMTAVAVMQLWEQGLIDLEAPIQQYIPDFPKKKEGEITTRHLLSHTSGIAGYVSGKEAETQKDYPTLADAMDVFKDRDLLFTPGTAFSYTTYGYVVLGRIIESVSGMNYEAYMIQNILEKVGMENTGIEEYQTIYSNKTKNYHRNRKGKMALAKKANNLSNRIPGGGFYSCVEDLLKFGEAIINNELIKESTLQVLLETPSLKDHGNPYAHGWLLYGGPDSPTQTFGHGGEQTGASTQLMITPITKKVVVVMGNTSGSYKEALILSVDLIKASKEETKLGE